MVSPVLKGVDKDRALADALMQEVAAWDARRARSQQTTLGPSTVGACREYIRATIARDEGAVGGDDTHEVKWPAFVGTILGDALEAIFAEQFEAITQFPVSATLPRTGLVVGGHGDVYTPALFVGASRLIDLKSKAELATVRRYGASVEYLIQISIYFLALVQSGRLGTDALASLVYIDRSGAENRFETITIDYEEALRWVDHAEDRLDDVMAWFEEGISDEERERRRWALRDKDPWNWCFNEKVMCKFRFNCWGSSQVDPPQLLQDEHVLAAERYEEASQLEKELGKIKNTAKIELAGVNGTSPDGLRVAWVNTGRKDTQTDEPLMRIDVRRIAPPATKG